MKSRLWGWLQFGVLGVCLAAQGVQAGEPVVGVDIGAAIPTSKFKRTADIGGAIAPFVGYQFGDAFAVSLLAQPQFAAFPTAVDTRRESDVTSVFSFTAGPRFSLRDETLELYFGAQGGLYLDVTGPLDDSSSAGFNFGGGLNYALSPATTLGLFARRDEADIRSGRNSNENLSFVVTGIDLTHRFLAPPPPPPPPPPMVAQAPPPPPPKKKIVLRGVNFDFDKARIRDDASPILDEAATVLKEESSITISVEGHTDSIGSEAYNEKLSIRRAEAVRNYLVDKGIAAGRMMAAGFGESKPVASNDTAEGRAQNRRVVLQVTSQPE